MSTPQIARTQAALAAMVDGKLLYKHEKAMDLVTDSAIFRIPNSFDYCVFIMVSSETLQQVISINCIFPLAQTLLRDLAGGGKYQDFQEASISCPDAQRVLEMFRHYMIISNVRHEKISLSGPDPDKADESDLSVQYT